MIVNREGLFLLGGQLTEYINQNGISSADS